MGRPRRSDCRLAALATAALFFLGGASSAAHAQSEAAAPPAAAPTAAPPAAAAAPAYLAPTTGRVDATARPAEEPSNRVLWLSLAAVAIGSGVALDVAPFSARNGELEAADFAPLALYSLGTLFVIKGVF
jgi:hypothetical protein